MSELTNCTVTHDNNFIRVFEVPKELPKGFCHGGGLPVGVKMVDWFQPIPVGVSIPNWECPILDYNVGEFQMTLDSVMKVRQFIGDFIRQKLYFKNSCFYICVTRYGDTFTVNYEGE